jgi:hypothetical protein
MDYSILYVKILLEIELYGKTIWCLVRRDFLIAVLIHKIICNQLLINFCCGPDTYFDAPVR